MERGRQKKVERDRWGKKGFPFCERSSVRPREREREFPFFFFSPAILNSKNVGGSFFFGMFRFFSRREGKRQRVFKQNKKQENCFPTAFFLSLSLSRSLSLSVSLSLSARNRRIINAGLLQTRTLSQNQNESSLFRSPPLESQKNKRGKTRPKKASTK